MSALLSDEVRRTMAVSFVGRQMMPYSLLLKKAFIKNEYGTD